MQAMKGERTVPDALLVTLVANGVATTSVFDAGTSASSSLGTPAGAIARIEADAASLALSPARGCELIGEGGAPVARMALSAGGEHVVAARDAQGAPVSIHIRPSAPGLRMFCTIGFAYDAEISIGRSEGCALSYASPFVSSEHASIRLVGDEFSVCDRGSANGTFVNGAALRSGESRALRPGDVVQVLDLIVLIGHRFVAINAPQGLVASDIPGAAAIDHAAFSAACPPASEVSGELPLFYPAPRLSHSVHPRAFQVDDPPAAKRPDDAPALMQLGPSFLMGIVSIFTVSSAVARLAGGADPMTTVPMLAMSVSMIGGMVIWPLVSKRYTKRRDARDELRRESAYSDYLNRMEARFGEECDAQAEILRDARTDAASLVGRALEGNPRLMNRRPDNDDFMTLRVGIGDAPLSADIRWPQQRFTMDSDKLLDKVAALAATPPLVRDVPLAFNAFEQRVAGVVGDRRDVWAFARGLIVQICALYSYQDVKLSLIADAEEEAEWGFLRAMPHIFDDAGVVRDIAVDPESALEMAMRFERELEARADMRAETPADYGAYHVIVCASASLSERLEVVSKIATLRSNKGFSLLFFGEGVNDLPRDCEYVIDLSEHGFSAFGSQDLSPAAKARAARMFARSDASGSMQAFDPDIAVSADDARAFALAMARVRLDIPSQRAALPASLGFLEMFKCGNVADLDIGRRWAEHDASRTLQTPVGVDAQGEWSMLNLHEKIHGPHGLVAGTTGSGKSEFIITYILSMCVNYPPDQVAFVLIDYKGGGLAGAFDNDRFRLPHLAGTITNLDGAAIARSLVSIKSELKRRQDLLNRAREVTGEATVDIYKYLSYYRQGVLEEPLPHLFLVADEFAELKTQEPEFMDELISAARIGRSLGVHLILATQKPSGVVNDQIWSNSRFKVCLKVADAADSKEMIKRPDAAEIKGPGRFYMLVGYNELFTGGQAAYAGGGYVERDAYEPRRDNAVELVDDGGAAIASLRPTSAARASDVSEMNAVLERVCETARACGKRAGRLWLDPLPDRIVAADLERRYAYERPDAGLAAVVGELDDPARQSQSLFSVDFAHEGNVLLYGAPGSGVDALAESILVSLATHYGPDELSIYAIDLEAGMLTALCPLPHCGGVVLAGDEERFASLMRLISGEMSRRRALFAQAGGSFERYNASAGRPLARIVLAIANMAAFYELHPDFEERIAQIARDAPRYGIHMLVTAASASGVRMRMRASFGAQVVTSFNDAGDYTSVLGAMRGVVPPKQDKRGLVRIGKELFEFQGASIAASADDEPAAIERLAQGWRERGDACATPIPALPPRVHAADMGKAPEGRVCVPVGFLKDEVEPAWFDFSRCPFMLVLGNDLDGIGRYLRGVRDYLSASGLSYAVVDEQGVLGEVDDARVLRAPAVVERVLGDVVEGATACDVLVFASIVQTIADLPAALSTSVQEWLSDERCVGSTAVMAACEMWRAKIIYADWFKVTTAYANGIWVGSGFADQAMFRYSRVLPAFRLPQARSEGFYALRGDVSCVRLIEAQDEGQDEAGR